MPPLLVLRACLDPRSHVAVRLPSLAGVPITYGAEVGRGLYFFFVTVSSIGLGDVTMTYSTVHIVLLQYFFFIPGMAIFAQFTAIGIEYARTASELRDDRA
jgi:hypothetical protein